MNWLILVFIAYLLGSLPFSVWLGKLLLRKDVRRYGDGNPGTANVFRAGNKALGFFVLLLDISKAAAPVGWAYQIEGIRGLPMALIGIAPVIGHVFSPFLGFRGGKGLATALGAWIGLTIWKASLAGVAGALIGLALFTAPGWAVMLGLGGILVTLLVWLPDPVFWLVWAAQTVLLAWTHREDLRQHPHLRNWLAKLLAQLALSG